jgi:hypothetical protein
MARMLVNDRVINLIQINEQDFISLIPILQKQKYMIAVPLLLTGCEIEIP